MKHLSVRVIPPALFALLMSLVGNSAQAQGTATGPFTAHVVQPGPVVIVGDPNNPIPIDLDPTGPPWSKSITDDNLEIAGGGILDIFETIENVGTEPWGDWHEEILGPPASLPPAIWANVVDLSINGTSISFTATGIGTQVLTLDTFSQPVLPGDVLTIHKQAEVFPNSAGATGMELIRLLEYPTPVPEPGTLVLATLGLISTWRGRYCR